MLIVFRIICLLAMALSGWVSMNEEEAATGASVIFLMSGTFFLLSFILEMTKCLH